MALPSPAPALQDSPRGHLAPLHGLTGEPHQVRRLQVGGSGMGQPARASPVGASHFFPEYLVSTVLSLSRDQVSARLCPPPGMWAGHSPGRGGGSWVREVHLLHPSPNPACLPSREQSSERAAVSVGAGSPPHLSAVLGGGPDWSKPNSVTPSPCGLREFGALCPQGHPHLLPLSPLQLQSR